jgi:hypothetical protein
MHRHHSDIAQPLENLSPHVTCNDCEGQAAQGTVRPASPTLLYDASHMLVTARFSENKGQF